MSDVPRWLCPLCFAGVAEPVKNGKGRCHEHGEQVLIDQLEVPDAAAMADFLEPFLRPGARMKGTPMVPLHAGTIYRIVAALRSRSTPVQKSQAGGNEDREGLVGRLRQSAQQSSDASRMLAEAKTDRQADRDDYPAMLVRGYSWLKPEQTVEWEAAARIEADARRIARLTEALIALRRCSENTTYPAEHPIWAATKMTDAVLQPQPERGEYLDEKEG